MYPNDAHSRYGRRLLGLLLMSALSSLFILVLTDWTKESAFFYYSLAEILLILLFLNVSISVIPVPAFRLIRYLCKIDLLSVAGAGVATVLGAGHLLNVLFPDLMELPAFPDYSMVWLTYAVAEHGLELGEVLLNTFGVFPLLLSALAAAINVLLFIFQGYCVDDHRYPHDYPG